MSGIVALVAFGIAIVATVTMFVLGFRAVMAIPTPDNLRPDLEPKRIIAAAVSCAIAVVGWLVGIIAGFTWIVETIAGSL